MGETPSAPTISTQLRQLAQQAHQYPAMAFTTLAHLIDVDLLQERLKQRIADGRMIGLIGTWRKAGVVEGDTLSYPERGSPQGGVVSPMLAHSFLHDVLDEWFEREGKPRMKGRCFLIRFADDGAPRARGRPNGPPAGVTGPPLREGPAEPADRRGGRTPAGGWGHTPGGCAPAAQAWNAPGQVTGRLMAVLPTRVARFGLTIHPQKTRLVAFRKPSRTAESASGNGTFEFLGFTHDWAKSRRGHWVIKRTTAKKRLRLALRAVWQWCRNHRHDPLREQYGQLSRKLRGHYQYYGIRGNYRKLEALYQVAAKAWRYWLSRRGQQRAIRWEKLT